MIVPFRIDEPVSKENEQTNRGGSGRPIHVGRSDRLVDGEAEEDGREKLPADGEDAHWHRKSAQVEVAVFGHVSTPGGHIQPDG